MREPALAADGRRGQPAAARAETCRGDVRFDAGQPLRDGGRVACVLDDTAAVGFDEEEENVLAGEARQQAFIRDRIGRVARKPRLELRELAQARRQQLRPVDRKPRRVDANPARGRAASGQENRLAGRDEQERRAEHRPHPARQAFEPAQAPDEKEQRDGESKKRPHNGHRRRYVADRAGEEMPAGDEEMGVEDEIEGTREGGARPHIRELHEKQHGRQDNDEGANAARRPFGDQQQGAEDQRPFERQRRQDRCAEPRQLVRQGDHCQEQQRAETGPCHDALPRRPAIGGHDAHRALDCVTKTACTRTALGL